MTSSVPPAPAATLLLVRDRDGLEVLMTQRHPDMRFGPGALVFPGGKLDAADLEPAWRERASGWAQFNEADCGLRLCAIRETFEETGILLGLPESGDSQSEDLAAARTRVMSGELSFYQAAAVMGWRPRLDALIPYARWITPHDQPIRFDAAFYIASAPPGQAAVCDGEETVAAEWLAPATALAMADAGRRKLMRPTRACLERLSASGCVAEALASARLHGLAGPEPGVLE